MLLLAGSSAFAQANLLFKETYGGDAAGSPRFRSTGLGAGASYTWFSGPGFNPLQGCNSYAPYTAQYTILRHLQRLNPTNCETWLYPNYIYKDHTNNHTGVESDTARGNFFVIDAGEAAGQFYTFTMNNLCPGNRLEFSLWAMNINPLAHKVQSGTTYLYPNLTFSIRNGVTNSVIHTYNTGNIPIDNDPASGYPFSATPVWHQYKTNFALPAGVTSVRVDVVNNAGGGSNGNDFALDDIALTLTGPTPQTTQSLDTTVCTNTQNFNLSGDFRNLYLYQGATQETPVILSNTLYYQWEFSTSNNPLGTWTNIYSGSQPANTATQMYSFSYTIPNMTAVNSGYYRLKIGGDAALSTNCSFTSQIKRITVNNPVITQLTNLGGNSNVFCDSSVIRIVPGGTYTSPLVYTVNSFLPATAESPYLMRMQGDTAYFKGTGTNNISFNIKDANLCASSNMLSVAVLCNTTVLPIQLAKITAKNIDNKSVNIAWTTDQEVNLKMFVVQKSTDGKQFEDIATVNSSSTLGNNNARSNYEIMDLKPANGKNLYRLKVVDLDQKIDYSKVVSANIDLKIIDINVIPNPVNGMTTIATSERCNIEIYNSLGKKMNIQIYSSELLNKFDANQLPNGIYIIKALNKDGVISSKMITK